MFIVCFQVIISRLNVFPVIIQDKEKNINLFPVHLSFQVRNVEIYGKKFNHWVTIHRMMCTELQSEVDQERMKLPVKDVVSRKKNIIICQLMDALPDK